MTAEDLLVFALKSHPGYVNGIEFENGDLAAIPADTVFLYLEGSSVTDEGIKSLPDLPNLRGIDLDSTKITDAALKRLGTFTSLEEIWIEDTAVTDGGLKLLQGLTNLKFISIIDCEISEEAVEAIRAAIPQVEVH